MIKFLSQVCKSRMPGCGSCTTFVRPTSRHILANKDAGLGVSSSFAVSTHCCTLKQTYSTSFQVTEIQTSSSLPHAHGLHWRDDLSEDDTRVLQVLQADEDCFKLSPQEVSSLLAYGTSAICVTLDPLRLRALHPKLTEQEALQVTLLAKHLQMHKYCQKCTERPPSGEECGQYYPQLPSLYPHFARLSLQQLPVVGLLPGNFQYISELAGAPSIVGFNESGNNREPKPRIRF